MVPRSPKDGKFVTHVPSRGRSGTEQPPCCVYKVPPRPDTSTTPVILDGGHPLVLFAVVSPSFARETWHVRLTEKDHEYPVSGKKVRLEPFPSFRVAAKSSSAFHCEKWQSGKVAKWQVPTGRLAPKPRGLRLWFGKETSRSSSHCGNKFRGERAWRSPGVGGTGWGQMRRHPIFR